MAEQDPRVLDALRLQLGARRVALAAGARRVGWKIGLGIAEVEALVGPAPVIGYLTSASLLDEGGRHRAGDARALHAETELAVEAGPSGAVAGLAVALELVDTARPPDGMEGIVAANVFHRAVAFGPTHRAADAAGARARLLIDGVVRGEGPVVADPGETLRTVARILAVLGERVEPGELVLCGSAVHVPVGRGNAVRAEIDGLGGVGAAVAG